LLKQKIQEGLTASFHGAIIKPGVSFKMAPPVGLMLKLGPSVRIDMYKKLIADYPDLEKILMDPTSKNEYESHLKTKGNTFKAFLAKDQQNSTVHYYLLPVSMRTTNNNEFAKVPNYKSFLTGLKRKTNTYMRDYGNIFSQETLDHEKFETLPENEQTVIEKFVTDPSQFRGCEVHAEVIASAPETSDISDGEPEVTPTFKSLNILEGSRYGKNIRLPKYNRTDNADTWVDKCCMILTLSGVTNPVRQISHLVTELSEEVQDLVLTEMTSNVVITILQFKKILRRCARLSDHEITRNLAALKFDEKTHKTFRNFFYKIKGLVQCQLPEGTDPALTEKVAIREFMTKCPDIVAKNTFFRNYPSQDVNALIDLADNIFSDSKKPSSSTELNHFPAPKTGYNGKGSKELYCSICNKNTHSTYKCFQNPKNPNNRLKGGKQESQKGKSYSKDKKDIKCYRCDMKGHTSRNCRTVLQ